MKLDKKFKAHGTTATALLCLSWLLADGVAETADLTEKLLEPSQKLLAALLSLAEHERARLKQAISHKAANGAIPGPFTADELCGFLDFIAKDKSRSLIATGLSSPLARKVPPASPRQRPSGNGHSQR